MATILFARHGETQWNRDGRFQGHADPPLNDAGRAQAEGLAERLEGQRFAAIYASDLRRAWETADIVAARLRRDVTRDAGLREIDVGSWSGLTRAEVAARDPDGFARWLAGEVGHDGETREQHLARVLAAVLSIGAAHGGERVLVVSHGGSLRTLQRHALGEPRPVLDNCGTYELTVVDGTLRAVD